MTPITVLYHAGCSDGFTAAWALRQVYPSADFIGVTHGHIPPDVTNRSVVIVDFSYPRQTMLNLAERAESLVTYDHHKSAEIELAGLPNCVFDMNRSGAGLAWDHLRHGDLHRPKLVDYVEDRDLWRNALPHSSKVSAVIQSTPFDFEEYDRLADDLDQHFEMVCEQGEVILGAYEHIEQRIIKSTLQNANILGHHVPAVNSPVFQSELGHLLDGNCSFAVAWYVDGEGLVRFSLRSTADGLDVSKIAKHFGGGGHEHSAGFSLPISRAMNMFEDGLY